MATQCGARYDERNFIIRHSLPLSHHIKYDMQVNKEIDGLLSVQLFQFVLVFSMHSKFTSSFRYKKTLNLISIITQFFTVKNVAVRSNHVNIEYLGYKESAVFNSCYNVCLLMFAMCDVYRFLRSKNLVTKLLNCVVKDY